jgi:hypothetical protein
MRLAPISRGRLPHSLSKRAGVGSVKMRTRVPLSVPDDGSPHPRPLSLSGLSGERGGVVPAEPGGGVAFSLSRLAGEGRGEGTCSDVE